MSGVAKRLRAFHFAWRGWFLGALLGAVAVARWRSPAPLEPAWLALAAAGLAWRAWAAFHIPGHSNGTSWAGPALAASGPYRISRHPLYFANLLTIAGLLLYAHCLPAWGIAFCLAAAAVHHEALARAEERFLLERLGDAYRGYMDVTPRWPRFPARGASGPAARPAGWREAWSRQAGNLAKACAGAGLLWILAAGSR